MTLRFSVTRLIPALLAPLALLAGCAQEPPKPVIDREYAGESRPAVRSLDSTEHAAGYRCADPTVRTSRWRSGRRRETSPRSRCGDNVVVRYYEALGAQLVSRGGTATGATTEPDSVVVGRAEEGARPSGVVSSKQTMVVKIKEVDTKNNVVSFYGEDGLLRAFPVQTDQGKEFIKKLKPGDEVGVTYTEALAVSVEPAK